LGKFASVMGDNLLEEAEEIAAGQKKAATFEDIFGSED